jgi:HEAT repeat protein
MAFLTFIRFSEFFIFARARAYKGMLPAVVSILILSVPALSAPARSVESLKADLQSGDLKLKYQAVDALGQNTSPAAGDALAAVLAVETDPNLLLAALDAVGRHRKPAHAKAIESLLNDSRSAIRQRAALTLGYVGGPTAEKALVRVFKQDQDVRVRSTALQSLGLIGTAASADDIQAAQRDADPQIRLKASHILKARKKGAR